jgi:hypothetical protein
MAARGQVAQRPVQPSPYSIQGAEPQLRASSRIISDAFSAIMITGALVLPEVIVGMLEASTARRPSLPTSASARRPRLGGHCPSCLCPPGQRSRCRCRRPPWRTPRRTQAAPRHRLFWLETAKPAQSGSASQIICMTGYRSAPDAGGALLIKFLGDAKLSTPGAGCRSWPRGAGQPGLVRPENANCHAGHREVGWEPSVRFGARQRSRRANPAVVYARAMAAERAGRAEGAPMSMKNCETNPITSQESW